jgi:hypothetical protein
MERQVARLAASTGHLEMRHAFACAPKIPEYLIAKPQTAARTRDCLEAAAQKEPSNANAWAALANVTFAQRLYR